MAEICEFLQDVESGVRIAVSRRDDATTVRLEGELDVAGQEHVRETVLGAVRQRPGRLILDLSRLSFIDSSGVHVLLEATARSAEQQTSLAIVPGPRRVQRVFEICGLTGVLPFIAATQK